MAQPPLGEQIALTYALEMCTHLSFSSIKLCSVCRDIGRRLSGSYLRDFDTSITMRTGDSLVFDYRTILHHRSQA
jgi:hypothetical protein